MFQNVKYYDSTVSIEVRYYLHDIFHAFRSGHYNDFFLIINIKVNRVLLIITHNTDVIVFENSKVNKEFYNKLFIIALKIAGGMTVAIAS